MKRLFKRLIVGALACGFVLSGFGSVGAYAKGIDKPVGFTTPYEKYGNLKVAEDPATGNQQLCDEDGNPVQLKGMSTFGLQWGDGDWILNDAAFDALAYDWKCDVIRLAMYVGEKGYATSPAECLAKVEQGIQLATDRGMYVIVDWHILSPGNVNADEYLNAGVGLDAYSAIKSADDKYNGPQLFFAYLSQKYGSYGNVLFETANEPNDSNVTESGAAQNWADKLLPYHQSVVDAIRKYDADSVPNIVICGTDNWSQFVDEAVDNPVVDPAVTAGAATDNQIMYTVHFYAGTHDTAPDEEGKYWLGSKIENALEGKLAVFCTEWGTSEATGDGGPYINYSERWLNYLAEKKISWCSWSLALKNEISAAFKSTAAKNPTDLDDDGIPEWDTTASDSNTDLSVTGNYVRAKIRGEEAPIYEAYETVIDFSDSNAKNQFSLNSDNPNADIAATNEEIGGRNYLMLENINNTGIWNNRIQFNDLTSNFGVYTDLTIDVVVPTSDIDKPLTIRPILQDATAERYWIDTLAELTTTKDDFTVIEGTDYSKATLEYSLLSSIASKDDVITNIILLSSAGFTFYIDNIGLKSMANGDISTKPKVPDKPGTFIGLPFTFEAGQREGWKPDGDSMIDYTTISVDEVGKDDHALSFPVALEVGKNEWEDGVRLSSSQNIFPLDSVEYDAFAMNVYIEKDKATTGEIGIEVCSIPAGDGYWYQSGSLILDPVNGGTPVTTPGGIELLKYSFYLPLNNKLEDYGEHPFSDNVFLRNVILALHGKDCDYKGRVYYDNIRYVDAQKLDDIDKEFNFTEHAKIILPLAAAEVAKANHVGEALTAILDDLMTVEIMKSTGTTLIDVAKNIVPGEVPSELIEDLMTKYTELNDEMAVNGDRDAYADIEEAKEVFKDLGATDDQIAELINPAVEALLKQVNELREENDEIKEEIADKQDKIDDLSEEAKKNSDEIEALKTAIKALEEEKAAQDAKIAENEALIKKLQEEAGKTPDATPTPTPTPGKEEPAGLAVGTQETVGKAVYEVKADGEVTLVKPVKKTLKSFVIESTVKLSDGKDYKVTAIAANAFKSNKKLTKVTIGENVASIGKSAFNGCKKLKTITVNTSSLTTKNVGASAFKGIKKKATFKVPKAKKSAYKKLFKKKGAKSPKIKTFK